MRCLSKLGYWKDHLLHPYKRRAVERDVVQFDGWQRIVELCNMLDGQRNQALFSAAFHTGGRITETLTLKKDFFMKEKEGNDEFLIVKGMLLEKHYNKTSSYIEWTDKLPDNRLRRLFTFDEEKKKYSRRRFETEKINAIRNPFRMPTNAPLMPIFLKQIDETEEGHYLFRGQKPDQPLGRNRAYKIITKTGIYPHYLRGQRASCLKVIYHMTIDEIMEWMGWEDLQTAMRYAKMGVTGLSERFKNIVYPEI